MTELLQIYEWTLFGGIFGGAALSLVGSQLASRNQAVQTLVVSQAASFGVVLGLAVSTYFGGDHTHPHREGLSPLLTGFLCAMVFYSICEFLITHRWVSRNTYYVGIFGLLSALTYTVIALVPSLETHMAASYFGDLTVASEFESIMVGSIGISALVLMIYFWRQITAWSFESVTFGSFISTTKDMLIQRLFLFSSLVLVSASVQFLGLLFTLSCLFLPSMILVKMQSSSRGLVAKLIFSSVLGIGLGFIFSLWHGKVPTVPCVAIGVLFFSFVTGILARTRISNET